MLWKSSHTTLWWVEERKQNRYRNHLHHWVGVIIIISLALVLLIYERKTIRIVSIQHYLDAANLFNKSCRWRSRKVDVLDIIIRVIIKVKAQYTSIIIHVITILKNINQTLDSTKTRYCKRKTKTKKTMWLATQRKGSGSTVQTTYK